MSVQPTSPSPRSAANQGLGANGQAAPNGAIIADPVDPARAGLGVKRWRQALAEHLGEDPGASLDEPKRVLTLLKIFGATRRLADLCLTYPQTAATALIEGPSPVLAEAARDLSALSSAIGGADALQAALTPIKARTDIALAIADISQTWTIAETTTARADLAERLVETALAWLIRSAMSRGEITAEANDGKLPGLFAIAGGEFSHEDLTPIGPLDLLIVYDLEQFTKRDDRMCERAFVRLGTELRDAFEGKSGDYPIYTLRTPMGSGVAGAGFVESRQTLEKAVGDEQRGPLRRWMATARIVAGDRAFGGSFLEDNEQAIWDDYPILTDRSREDLTTQSQTAHGALQATADVLRLSLGRARAVFRTASTAEVFSTAASSGALSPAVAARLAAGFDLSQGIVTAQQTIHGTDPNGKRSNGAGRTGNNPSSGEAEAVAALCGFHNTDNLETVRRGIGAEAQNALSRLLGGARLELQQFEPATENNTDPTAEKSDADKLESLGFLNGTALTSVLDGWAALCSDGDSQRFAAVAPGMITAFGQTQYPDTAIRLYDQLIHSLGDNEKDLRSAITSSDKTKSALADAFGTFGDVVSPLLQSADTRQFLTDDDEGTSPRSATEFMSRFAPPRAGENAGKVDDIIQWRASAMALAAFKGASGSMDFGAIAETYSTIQKTALALAFERITEAHGIADGLALHVFDGAGFGLPDVPITLGFMRTTDEADKADEAARAFIEAVGTFGTGVFALTPDVARRPGGVAGVLVPTTEEFRSYIRSEAIATDQIMLARGQIIAGPTEGTTEALRAAVANPRRTDILFRDLDRARAQRLRKDREISPWEITTAEGGLWDTELILSTLIYRHGASNPALQRETPEAGIDLLVRSNLLTAEVGSTLKSARSFWRRLMTARTLARWSDPSCAPVRPRLAEILARSAEVEHFTAVRPIMRGYADEITRLYAQLVLGRPSLSLVANG
ncbi:MAG: hypothetical protein AAFY84_12385 [Pseudomonadota bacterium]